MASPADYFLAYSDDYFCVFQADGMDAVPTDFQLALLKTDN
jgi:hypothetical protein